MSATIADMAIRTSSRDRADPDRPTPSSHSARDASSYGRANSRDAPSRSAVEAGERSRKRPASRHRALNSHHDKHGQNGNHATQIRAIASPTLANPSCFNAANSRLIRPTNAGPWKTSAVLH